jgi:hypothetical protein
MGVGSGGEALSGSSTEMFQILELDLTQCAISEGLNSKEAHLVSIGPLLFIYSITAFMECQVWTSIAPHLQGHQNDTPEWLHWSHQCTF